MNKRKLKLIQLFSFTIFVSLGLSASRSSVSAFQTGLPLDQALVYGGAESSNLRDYDPATTYGSGDKLAFSGLVAFDPHLNLRPDLAETWDVSGDGMVYTFHLRENARFHDKKPVTADDVIYSWERALSPEIASDTALTYLGDIAGTHDFYEGKTEHVSGLKALNDLTLQVTIDAPKPYFLLKLTFPTAFIVDRENVEQGENWVHAPNGTSPYRIKEWRSNEYILYEANQDFYLGAPAIPYVVVKLFSGDELRLFETGKVDIANIGSYNVDRILDSAEPLKGQLVTGVNLCTGYIVFDNTRPPFDDINVRKAFSMAFDRERFIDVIMGGKALPAIGPYPPGLPGFNYQLQGLPYDPARARQLLKQSKYGGPEGLPAIIYTDSGVGSHVSPDVAAMAEMWHQNLGVTITIENIEYDNYYEQIYSGNHGQIFGGGWCADYPDPENFADVLFHSDSTQNNGGYSNAGLDTLLEKARVEKDVSKRITMYQEAEQMIVNDAPVLFTTHSFSYQLVQPYVKGFIFSPISIPIERYLWLDGK